MSHVRVLICRVDETDEQMTELDRLDLPPGGTGDDRDNVLDTLEAQVATVGQRLLGRLVELQWEEIDAQLVARYRGSSRPGQCGGRWLGAAAGGQPLRHAGGAHRRAEVLGWG